MPLLAVGFAFSQLGFLGAYYRYIARETAPVTKDLANDIGEGIQPGIKAVAKAVTEGIIEGRKTSESETKRDS